MLNVLHDFLITWALYRAFVRQPFHCLRRQPPLPARYGRPSLLEVVVAAVDVECGAPNIQLVPARYHTALPVVDGDIRRDLPIGGQIRIAH